MEKDELFQKIRGGLIVSCQALEDEPLHSSYIMSRMALAALQGGAVGIRANTVEDIAKIKNTVDLPVIGIIKQVYNDSDVYITPTIAEVDALMAVAPNIIAMDATARMRTGNRSLTEVYRQVRQKYPNAVLMADCSTVEEGVEAEKLGFDCVGTTMAGYTPYTAGRTIPDFEMIRTLSQKLSIPVIAEGGIHTPGQLRQVIDSGAWCAVIGGAITRPQEVTKRFTDVL